MYLQGQLQLVFDALYQMGIIQTVLKADWQPQLRDNSDYAKRLAVAAEIANSFQNDPEKLVSELEKLDAQTLKVLAMEVAREFADYHACPWTH